MDMERFFSYLLPYLLKGVPVTISVTLIALVFGGAVGLLMAVFRVYGNSAIRKALTIYSTVFRAVPQLVLLLLLYFSIAGSINISAYWAAALSLAVISSAYQLEIFRGTFQSIDPGQMMAARAIGMSRQKAICKILIPQAVRKAIPAWTNEMATTIKSSSLVYVLGVPEMLRLAHSQSRDRFWAGQQSQNDHDPDTNDGMDRLAPCLIRFFHSFHLIVNIY